PVERCIGWQCSAGQGTKSRQQIDGTKDAGLIDATCGNITGPTHDEGQPNAPFVQAELASAEASRPSDLKGRKCPVVAGKNDKRLPIDLKIANTRQQPTDLPVRLAHD